MKSEEEIVLDLEREMLASKTVEDSRISKMLLPDGESNELVEAFLNLDINDKRNEFNIEIIKIFEILKEFMNIDTTYKLCNYNKNVDSILNEDNYLALEYQNIMKIRQYILEATTVNLEKSKDHE